MLYLSNIPLISCNKDFIIMPSKSEKQHNLMEAVAHNPKFAKESGIPQSVGKEFVAADSPEIYTPTDDTAKNYRSNSVNSFLAIRQSLIGK